MDDTKPCPYCGEPIKKIARKCKWCGEFLDEENRPTSVAYITCPTCGEQIPSDSKICPLCNEPLTKASKKENQPTKSKNKRTVFIILGIIGVVLLIIGGLKFNSHLTEKELEESYESSPYSILSKNLEEAITNGQKLNAFLRDPKNVDALKAHFGEDEYSLIIKLSNYSDAPLSSNDPEDQYAGGYAWRSAGEEGRYGCRLYLGYDKLGCKYYYDGFEVDAWGNLEINSNWERKYYKDDFNEDIMEKPYIELWFKVDETYDVSCFLRLDNIWGVSFRLTDFHIFDNILLRNNDTDEVWDLPLEYLNSNEAILQKEGYEKFTRWFQTAKSITISFTDDRGKHKPYTTTLYPEKLRFYQTFMHHVMKKSIDKDIFLKTGLE